MPDDDLNLELEELNRRLREFGYGLDVEAVLGTTFSRGDVKGSILKSGVTILEGVRNKEEAVKLHESLLRL